jgi:hypothetical protein
MDFDNLSGLAVPTINSYYTQTAGITTVNAIDGFSEYAYLVGKGIQKLLITVTGVTLTNIYTTNTTYTYYGVYAYSDTYVIAVGTNIISYTTDGTNWTNSINKSGLSEVYGISNQTQTKVDDETKTSTETKTKVDDLPITRTLTRNQFKRPGKLPPVKFAEPPGGKLPPPGPKKKIVRHAVYRELMETGRRWIER